MQKKTPRFRGVFDHSVKRVDLAAGSRQVLVRHVGSTTTASPAHGTDAAGVRTQHDNTVVCTRVTTHVGVIGDSDDAGGSGS